jgi:hypothetical protein
MILGMLPWKAELAGRVNEHVISSELLRDNPLGDSRDRPLLVYTPPATTTRRTARTPPST